MKLSVAWLKSLAPVEWDADEIARRLTLAGLEIEGIERKRLQAEGVVVGRVLDARQHPNADKLRLARVDAGGEVLDIVCGAPNCRTGITVALARIGAKLPGGLEIKRAKIRGEESFGMLCSASELGLSSASDGIMELDEALSLGQPLQQALGLDDDILEASPTANRGDLLSHIGVARELAALAGIALVEPASEVASIHGAAAVPVRIDAPSRCTRYIGRVVTGLTARPSPAWMRQRLESVGVRPINALVDVTNYVLMEYGQPLHAFDLAALRGPSIEVRLAQAGERMQTLDGVERSLESTDLLICDAEGPVALAGVMGGLNTEIKDSTTQVFLEAAHFEPTGVRATSRRLGLRSESSHRYERGVDPDRTREAADRAVHLLLSLAGGANAAASEVVSDAHPAPRVPVTVDFAPTHTRRRLGAQIDAGTQRVALGRFGFEVSVTEDSPEAPWRVVVPGWRPDVSESADLVEEVARFVGFDAIPTAPARISANTRVGHARDARLRALRAHLQSLGFDQALNYPFSSAELLARFDDRSPLGLVNPLSDDLRVMRTTMLPRLVANVSHNARHGHPDLGLFEVGRVFLPRERGEAPDERERLGLVLSGHGPFHWSGTQRPVDFFDLKGVLESLFELAGLRSVRWQGGDAPKFLHPGVAARIVDASGAPLGLMGELHPTLVRAFELEAAPLVAELELAPLLDADTSPQRFVDFARFPTVKRDIALVLDRGVTAADVIGVVEGAGISVFDGASIFDVYEGDGVGVGKKSLGLTLTWRAADRTLTDDEVATAQALVLERLSATLGATLR